MHLGAPAGSQLLLHDLLCALLDATHQPGVAHAQLLQVYGVEPAVWTPPLRLQGLALRLHQQTNSPCLLLSYRHLVSGVWWKLVNELGSNVKRRFLFLFMTAEWNYEFRCLRVQRIAVCRRGDLPLCFTVWQCVRPPNPRRNSLCKIRLQ